VESYIKSSKTKPTKISTPIDLIKNDEAKMIGSSFAWYLSMELSTYNIASNAVDTWIRSYPALISLDEQHPGFRCVMEAFGVEFFKRVNWGLKLRVLAGTVLSLGDLISDLTMVQIYAGRGETFQESFVLACVVSCLACQTFCAFINHPNIPPCERFAECLVAAIGCRPIVDAYRVSLGVAKRQGSLVTPFMDMAINRGENGTPGEDVGADNNCRERRRAAAYVESVRRLLNLSTSATCFATRFARIPSLNFAPTTTTRQSSASNPTQHPSRLASLRSSQSSSCASRASQ
jgi:hypothetical protein